MKNLIKTIFAITIVLTIACKKDGTPGPIGPNGTNGTTGTNGTNGTNGTTGSIGGTDTIIKTDTIRVGATVMYSDWFTPGPWTSTTITPIPTGTGTGPSTGNSNIPTTVSPNQSHFFNKAAPAITQSILDKGIVLAYCKLTSDGSNTRPLPANTTIEGVLNLWNYVLSLGNIQFTQFSTSPLALNGIDQSNKFRYVIIPATTHLRLSKQLKDMSYEEVCSLFNIPK